MDNTVVVNLQRYSHKLQVHARIEPARPRCNIDRGIAFTCRFSGPV